MLASSRCAPPGKCALGATRVRGEQRVGLKSNQPALYREAERRLGNRGTEHADAASSDHERGCTVVRRSYPGETPFAPEGWAHPATLVRVESETLDAHGERISYEKRYFVSSLPRSRLKDELWLLLIRRHWGVEPRVGSSTPRSPRTRIRGRRHAAAPHRLHALWRCGAA
jgi:hypothetical protein